MKWYILLFLLMIPFVSAQSITCSFSTSCSNTALLRAENDTGGFENAHAELSNLTEYGNILCCSGSSLSTACGTSVLKLSNGTNAHIEQANNTNYNETICLSSAAGTIDCTYSNDNCASGYDCIASIASDPENLDNSTNAHIGSCNSYARKVCCRFTATPSAPGFVSAGGGPFNCPEGFVPINYQCIPKGFEKFFQFFIDFAKKGPLFYSIIVLNEDKEVLAGDKLIVMNNIRNEGTKDVEVICKNWVDFDANYSISQNESIIAFSRLAKVNQNITQAVEIKILSNLKNQKGVVLGLCDLIQSGNPNATSIDTFEVVIGQKKGFFESIAASISPSTPMFGYLAVIILLLLLGKYLYDRRSRIIGKAKAVNEKMKKKKETEATRKAIEEAQKKF